ncbi:hypothetical protein CAPTEDRAFT_229327 [Capitella teleta]|uniref:Uncharacterized protein n=1 Tax=Capitella teleta TaxID=283909 RepID=R7VJK3_CAPTE|nr:hypothetical protein CAPTEDRAFT_229327 [Capitella teleta]|eukprot:ELU18777.1 hypothetical protein CAPTEDRAFT_229327 [Capitella teleta]
MGEELTTTETLAVGDAILAGSVDPAESYRLVPAESTASPTVAALAPMNETDGDYDVLMWKLALTVAVCLALFVGSLVILATIAYNRRKSATENSGIGPLTYQNPTDVLLDENDTFQDIDANGNNSGVVSTTAELRTPIYIPGVHTLHPPPEASRTPRSGVPPTQKLNRAPFNSHNYQTGTPEQRTSNGPSYVTLEV